MHAPWIDAVGEAVAGEPVAVFAVGGGDFATAARVQLADGRTVFAKTHRDPPAGFFSTEAASLAWLHDPGAAHVARVLAVSDDNPVYLVLEWIETAAMTPADEAEFGRQLAALHASGADAFGRADRRSTGSLGLPNRPCDSWTEFYATQRLEPLAQIAADRNALTGNQLDRLEMVVARLGDLGGPSEPPARLHGDLWAGNRVVDVGGRSWLIDPAAHGGHREYDLAMMRLFGGFSGETFAAYDEALPLAAGWRQRVPLHQLAPLIVHAIKFGGGYVAAVDQALLAVLNER